MAAEDLYLRSQTDKSEANPEDLRLRSESDKPPTPPAGGGSIMMSVAVKLMAAGVI
jgi:hypothetical protein